MTMTTTPRELPHTPWGRVRQSRRTADRPLAGVDPEGLVRLMVGRDPGDLFPAWQPAAQAETAIEIKGFRAGAAREVFVQGGFLLGRQLAIGIGDDLGAGDVSGHLQHQARVDRRLIDAGVLQTILGGGPGFDEGQGHGRGLALWVGGGEMDETVHPQISPVVPRFMRGTHLSAASAEQNGSLTWKLNMGAAHEARDDSRN